MTDLAYRHPVHTPRSSNDRPRSSSTNAGGRPSWPLLFLVAYIGCQVALLFLGSTPLRVPLRIGAFSASLGLLALLRPAPGLSHPAARFLPWILLCLIPGLFNPEQTAPVAAIAQAMLYVATLSPLIWVASRPIDRKLFRRIVIILWSFNTLSAAVGVLQVYRPGLFQAQLSSVIQSKGADFVGSLTIQLADGTRVLRPMGLTDMPGGAANGGLYAIVFGIGIFFTEKRWLLRALAAAGMVIGLMVIYLTHVRVTLLMSAIDVIVIGIAFSRRGDVRRVSTLLTIALSVAFVGTVWAFTVGGEDTVNRFSSLTESSAGEVYGANRGMFLQDAFTQNLFDYPLGAGMGRWGMMNYYFGDPSNSLWAEVMWQAWIYDGGLPLMAIYCATLFVTVLVSWRMATGRGESRLAIWAAILLAYNVAAVAATFDAPVFATQAALELWFLNACLYNAWRTERLATSRPPRLPAERRTVPEPVGVDARIAGVVG